ncbi:MAG TPA: YhcH/YjgK/YiaL family protein [Puia sp.]|jgi:YhcH/YjgK/YiaL family protein|nr:YhcH/YjgK/YiaL family protein [Puia sp.]
MITSTLAQLHWYKTISPNFEKAIQYSLSADFVTMEPGKYQIDGEDIFAIVNEYTTKPLSECDPESHQDYADIQIIISGTERFGYTPLTDQSATTPYNPEKDFALYDIPEEAMNYITLPAGQFIIFFPSDIHQPEIFLHQPALVKKVVIKVGL